MEYLLDADWAIQVINGQPRPRAILDQLAPRGIAVSWITIAEIYEGAFGLEDPQAHLAAFRRFLAPFPVLGLDEGTAERFAELRALLRRRGDRIADFDLLIAATALHHNLTLLTFNLRHFQRVPGLQLYQAS